MQADGGAVCNGSRVLATDDLLIYLLTYILGTDGIVPQRRWRDHR